MNPADELRVEHDSVLTALQLLEKVEDAIDARKCQAADHLEQLIDFLNGFVNCYHHGKEEDVLFPELKKHGVRLNAGPVGIMLAEHTVGRAHTRGMSDALGRVRAGDYGALSLLHGSSLAYRELLRAHIGQEDNVLFVMADQFLPEDVKEVIAIQFDKIERERAGEGKLEAYHALLHRLKDIYGVA